MERSCTLDAHKESGTAHMHLRELQYETRFTFCFQGQTQQLYQHLWISGSLKSVLWYWSEMKQSTAITLAVYCNTPLLQEKSCAEGKSCLNSEYCRDWQGLVQLQLPLGGAEGTRVRPGRSPSYCWASQLEKGTRQSGKWVSEITKALHP